MKSLKESVETASVNESVIGKKNNRSLDRYRNMIYTKHFEELGKACSQNHIEFYPASYVNILRENRMSLETIDRVVMAMYRDRDYSEVLEGCNNTEDVADSTMNYMETHRI